VRGHLGQLILAAGLFAGVMVLLVASARAFWRYREHISRFVGDTRRRVLTSRQYAALRERFPRVRSFVAARFARGEYLGLHLTVGFLISVGALLLFAAVTEDVVNHEPLTVVDLQLLSWIRSHATPAGDRFAMGISSAGGPTSMAIMAIVVAIVLASRRWWITLAAWIAALAGGGALDWLLKVIIRRPRPVGAEQFLTGHSFSFPSGHSMGSLVGLGMFAYVLIAFWLPARRHRTLDVALTFVGELLIGASLKYLGFHYLSDVIA
jgi:membrane-associated phospholipid phosphatase